MYCFSIIYNRINAIIHLLDYLKAKTIFYSLTKEYEKVLQPFFKMLEENKILETV